MKNWQTSVSRILSQDFIWVAALTLFGAGLRLYHLGFKSLWVDEAGLYWIAQSDWARVISENALRNSAPFLFAFLVKFVSRIGESETLLRSVAWFAGVAALPALYWLARQFMSRLPALFAVFVAAMSVTQIQYAQQLREYSMTFLAATLMLVTFYRELTAPSRSNWVLLVVAWVFGIFTQYGLALLALALNVVMAVELSKRDWKKGLPRWIGAQFFVLVAAGIVFELSLKYQLTPGGFGTGAGSGYLETTYWNGTLPSLARLAAANTYNLLYFSYPNAYLVAFVIAVGAWAMLKARGGGTNGFAHVHCAVGDYISCSDGTLVSVRWRSAGYLSDADDLRFDGARIRLHFED